MRRLPDSYYSGSFCFAPFHYILHSTAAMAAPSAADATMGDTTTPDRAATPQVAVTTGSSDQGAPPPQTYNESNYRFNHSTPGNTAYYNPATVMEQLHITEYQTTTTQENYYLPTIQHPQTIYKVDYDMTTFTDNYSLRNNYIWNDASSRVLNEQRR